VAFAAAEKIYNKVLKEKTGKGYTVVRVLSPSLARPR